MRPEASRKLSESESRKLRKALLQKWNFSFAAQQPLPDVMGVPLITVSKDDLTDIDYAHIIQMISLYTGFVYELTESGNDVQRPVLSFHPDSFETVFCDDTFDWIVYASSDHTLSFGGDWLTELLNKMFSGRKNKIMTKKTRLRAR